MKQKRLKIDWVSVVYHTEDQKLIDYFWWHFNHHRISKQRSARCALIHYYSTTPCPDFVKKYLRCYHVLKVSKFNWLEADLNEL